MDQKNYTLSPQQAKANLKQSMEEAKENISHTVENITHELKETLDWRSWVQRYPTGFALGALAIGFWIGKNFTPSATGSMSSSATGSMSSEARRDISQIPNILGSMLAGLLTKKTTEFIEGLGRSTTHSPGRAGTSSL
jgi:hypothetical protein